LEVRPNRSGRKHFSKRSPTLPFCAHKNKNLVKKKKEKNNERNMNGKGI